MSHVLSDEQMAFYIQNMKTAKELLEKNTEELNDATEKLALMDEVLKQSNDDIRLLLAFIKSKGLQPPKIQSKFIN